MQNSINQITIGIPFFNDSRYLDMAIRSVINQTYQDWVLLLVDDGSSDGSLDIAKSYAENDTRITVISDGQNRQLPYRLNQIASLTKTSYLARMDADDIMHPERLAIQLEILESNPDIDVLGTNAYTIDADNNITGLRQPSSNEIITAHGFIHPSVMAKSSWYKKNKYDEAAVRSEDTLLWGGARQHSVFRTTRQPLMFYREVGGTYYKKYWIKSKAFLYMAIDSASDKRYSKYYLLKESVLGLLKGVTYLAFTVLGQEDRLIRNRNKGVLSANQANYAIQLLKAAIAGV